MDVNKEGLLSCFSDNNSKKSLNYRIDMDNAIKIFLNLPSDRRKWTNNQKKIYNELTLSDGKEKVFRVLFEHYFDKNALKSLKMFSFFTPLSDTGLKFCDIGILTQGILSSTQKDAILDFYRNWKPGKLCPIPHAILQLKAGTTKWSFTLSDISVLTTLNDDELQLFNDENGTHFNETFRLEYLAAYPDIKFVYMSVGTVNISKSEIQDQVVAFDAKLLHHIFSLINDEQFERLQHKIQSIGYTPIDEFDATTIQENDKEKKESPAKDIYNAIKAHPDYQNFKERIQAETPVKKRRLSYNLAAICLGAVQTTIDFSTNDE